MNAASTLKPDEYSRETARVMLQRHDVMREILAETIEAANKGQILESGRTKCPNTGRDGKIRDAFARHPRAIDLAPCRHERGGAWHTHVTEDELRYPENSLPDMANVVYGAIDVSIVVGTQTADVFMSAGDDEALIEEFENAIGEQVGSPKGLAEAMEAGRVNPVQSRKRVREALPNLFETHETNYAELDEAVDELFIEEAPRKLSSRDEVTSEPAHELIVNRLFSADSIDQAAEQADLGGVDLSGLVISTVLGNIVGEIANRVIWGER